MKKSKKWLLPEGALAQGETCKDGSEMNRAMTGAYYASSLEYSTSVVPQYVNAGDLAAPAYDEVTELFKPAHPYGTFGALISDEDVESYRYQSERQLVEIPTVEVLTKSADALLGMNSATAPWITDLGFKYVLKDGTTMDLKEAIRLQGSFKEHNLAIQAKIDSLIKEAGYAPEVRNGKVLHKKFPDDLLSAIANLAKQKKGITGFNMKIQVSGVHTIANADNYVKCSDPDGLNDLRKKVNYKKKNSFLQGTVRVGTIIVPIQTVEQARRLVSAAKKLYGAKLTPAWDNLDKLILVKGEMDA